MISALQKRKTRPVKWIRRGIILLLLCYLLAALVPYIFPPTAAPLSADWQVALSSDENVNSATLLETGEEAMATRLKLITEATDSIRVASYIYAKDESGQIISAALLAAADRGVKIHILIDGLIGVVNLRDDALAYALGSHPNIDLRFYNPINLLSPEGLNARFHEKYFIVDDQWLALGGRNVSDEFLTPSHDPHYNFDLDVLLRKDDMAAYDAVSQVSEYFDTLWMQEAPQFDTVSASRAQAVEKAAQSLRQRAKTLNTDYGLSTLDLNADLVPVQKTLYMVNPTRAGVKEPILWKQLCALMGDAKERLWILTPYLVMDHVMRDDLTALPLPEDAKLMLNSRNSGNNIIASSDYVIHRGMALRLGIPVYEFQGHASMHTKSVLIDDDLSIFGSFNFDIRSAYIDTETMLAVYSPELNAQLEAYMSPMYAQALLSTDTGYAPDPSVEPKEGSFWKTLCIYLLSPFVALFRFLA